MSLNASQPNYQIDYNQATKTLKLLNLTLDENEQLKLMTNYMGRNIIILENELAKQNKKVLKGVTIGGASGIVIGIILRSIFNK